VISGAASGVEDMLGLVVAAALAPAEGERLGALGSRFPPPPAGGAGPGRDANPIAARSFADPAGPPGWTRLPAWFLVSTQDRMINPDLERRSLRR
jgi:hypothetical protein